MNNDLAAAREKESVESGITEGWNDRKNILVILAHPDDPEYFCGGSIARWAQAGHNVSYCLFTRGEKGVQDILEDPVVLANQRENEQRNAAKILGVDAVRFLDFEDGGLQPTMEARKAIVRIIREEKPDILVTSDPTNYFPRENRINHPDHRIAGQIVTEAVFPASGNPLYFPDLLKAGYEPHLVKELWLTLTTQGNVDLDVTEWWEQRINALKMHHSQVPDADTLEENQRSRRSADSTLENPRYIEKFRRIKFK